MNAMYYLIVTLLVSSALLLSLIVLVQKSRGGSLFSNNTGPVGVSARPTVLFWTTSILFAVFLCSAVTLNILAR
jgi:protein translocase SecG subunit